MLNLIKNTLGIKKEWPRTKTGLAEKDVKSNEWPMPPGFDRFENFGHDELTAKLFISYFRCSRPPDVDGIKILIKMTRPQNIEIKEKCFVAWSSLSKSLIPSISEALST